MHPSTALQRPLRVTRSVTGALTKPLVRPLAALRPVPAGTVAFDLTSEDAEYLRQLAPGITRGGSLARPTPGAARDRAEEARRAAARYLDARRAELRDQLSQR